MSLAVGTSEPDRSLEALVPVLAGLAPDLLREVLDEAPGRVPGLRPDERAAGVLLALRHGPAGPEVLLLRRSAHLDQHAGQIGLPGGRCDPGDAGPVQTALREAAEEVGLLPAAVRILGTLGPWSVPVSRHRVLPVVGWLEPETVVAVASGESEACWFSPLAELVAGARPVELRGMPAWEFPSAGGRIWGFTALVLGDLLERLAVRSRGAGRPSQLAGIE